MSVYNGEPYVNEAIESILNQTYSNFKFIIINNSSDDNTLKILKFYEKQDKRISIISNQEKLSYVKGRMLGIEKVNTKWFALMDADDVAETCRFERQMKIIDNDIRNELCAVGTWAKYIGSNGKLLGSMKVKPTTIKQYDSMYINNEAIVLIDPSTIIHLDTFLKAGGYREESYPPCDLDLWYRMSETGKKMLVLPEFLMRYRIHSGSNSVKSTMLQRKMTHFVNFNMRRRRANVKELSAKEFNEQIWSSLVYKIPRMYRDITMSLYKKSALKYAEGLYIHMLFNLLVILVIRPNFVIKKIVQQKLL